MIIYLQNALAERKHRASNEGRSFTKVDLHGAIMEGAVDRVRPKMMKVAAIMAGLVPILWSSGSGSELLQRIAVPMIGGMVSSTVLTLVVIPAMFSMVEGARMRNLSRHKANMLSPNPV